MRFLEAAAAGLAALWVFAGSNGAAAARLELSTKYSHSVGDFGSGRTIHNDFQPSKIALKTGPLTLKAETSYWHNRDRWTDLRLGLTYLASPERTAPFEVFLHTNAKVPTTEERPGFFSGAPDYGASLEVGRAFGPAFVFIESGLDDLGNGAGAEPDDVHFIAFGVALPLSQVLEAEVAYDWASAPFDHMPDYRKANFKLVYSPDRPMKITLDAGRGFSDEADNWSVGLRVSVFRPVGRPASRKATGTDGERPPAVTVEEAMRPHRDRFLSERYSAQAPYKSTLPP